MPLFKKNNEQGYKQPSCFLFFFLGGREKDIVQDEPIAGRIGIHVEFGRRVAYQVPIVLWVVASEKGPEPVSEIPMDVAVLP